MINYRHSHQICKKITRNHSLSFYYTFSLLRRSKRQAIYATNAFFVFTYQGMKEAHTPGQKQMHFKKCQDIIKRAYRHSRDQFTHPIEPALEQTLARYEIPEKFFTDFLTGVHLHEYFKQPQDERELLEYCHYTSGCIAQIFSFILAQYAPPLHEADCLGIARELSRITARISEHKKTNRTYVPQSYLENGQVSPMAVEKLVQTAENFNNEAWLALSSLERGGSQFAAALILLTINRVLRKIKRNAAMVLTKPQDLNWLEKLFLFSKALTETSGVPNK